MNDLLRINKFGFNQLKDKPTQEALQEWYAKTYYQTTPDTGMNKYT